MSIKMQEICRDTRYFFNQNIKTIFFISLMVTFFSSLLDLFIKSNVYTIAMMENQTFNQIDSIKTIIDHLNQFKTQEIFIYLAFKIIELLTNKTLLLGSIIALIMISSHQKRSILLFFRFLLPMLPKLFVINMLILFIIQFSYVFFIIPGILASMLLMLSPVICSFQENSIINSIYSGIYLSRKHIKIIGPAIFLWILGKFFLIALLSHMIIVNQSFSYFILNISINMIYSMLIIYFFRFYMLVIRPLKPSTDISCII